MTVSGRTVGDIAAASATHDREVIRTCEAPLQHRAGFIVLSGNFFDSAIMKMSVVGEAFRRSYLETPGDENAFEARAIVFDGPDDYHARIDDPALNIDEHCILVIRGCGDVGYPGSAEVVNMAPPAHLIKRGIDSLPCLGDGRQSGTSASPSILNMSPDAAAGGGLTRCSPMIARQSTGTSVRSPCWWMPMKWRGARPMSRRCRFRHRRHPGRSCTGNWWGSYPPGTAWSRPRCIYGWSKPVAIRAIRTEGVWKEKASRRRAGARVRCLISGND